MLINTVSEAQSAEYPSHALPDPADQPPRLLPGGRCHAQVMCSNIGKDEDMRPLLLQTGEVPSTAAEQAGAPDQLGSGHRQEDVQGGDHDNGQ